MTRPEVCPNCGRSVSHHEGLYCEECDEPLTQEDPDAGLVVPAKRSKYPRNPRGFVTHGWAFGDYSNEDVDKIKKFLETGLVSDLPDSFKAIARKWAEAR